LTTVLIDGYALSDASQQRGIGSYLKRLLGGLEAHPEIDVEVLAAPGANVVGSIRRIPVRHWAPPRFRDSEHELRLPFELRRGSFDVFHSPAQHPPRRCVPPWVQTLHDLTPLVWPHPLLAGERRHWLRTGPRLRQAARVIAVSRFSAEQGIRLLGLDPALVTVIPHGVDHSIFHPADRSSPADPYLLHVAAYGPHKGFAEALAVIAQLGEGGFPHRLVMAGPNDAWMRRQIDTIVAASARPDLVEIAGYVEDLPALYRGASALLMTSRSEGFGLPALEAMACGTPVVAFANSSLPEVVGEGGILVPDGDVEAMTRAARMLIANDQQRAELVERAMSWASQFRWEDTINAHAELFRSVAR
jgi:glycosyltransferase involved in cell wall biosynthesis